MIEVDYLMLADAATVAEGKHYIHGAGWDIIGAAAFPVTRPITVAVLLRVPWNDTNQQQTLELNVLNADGVSILPDPPGPLRGPIIVGRPPHVPAGQAVLVPLVFSLVGVCFDQPGTYVVVMRVDGIEAKRFPFHLVTLPPQISPVAPASR
jgi:hypothetical protein